MEPHAMLNYIRSYSRQVSQTQCQQFQPRRHVTSHCRGVRLDCHYGVGAIAAAD